jgi:hypothetical protein
MAFGYVVARVAGGPAAMAIGMSSDNPAVARQREEERAQTEAAKDFMRKHSPNKVKINCFWFRRLR